MGNCLRKMRLRTPTSLVIFAEEKEKRSRVGEPNLSTVRLRLSVVLRETWASDEQFIFME